MVTLVVGAALAGCQTPTHDERSEGRMVDDKNITADVEKNLEADPTYKFESVGVRTFAGVVELSGFVNNEDQKTRAETIAKNTQGVREVANGITLKAINTEPTGRTNNEPRVYSEPQSKPAQESK
jgi:osmotically-inducible protein OsmY